MSLKDFGLKDFKNISVIQLKEYLQNRGFSLSGYIKPALVKIATAVNKMMLPLNPNFEKKNTLENEKFLYRWYGNKKIHLLRPTTWV